MTIEFEVSATNGKPQRTVIARFLDGKEHRDVIEVCSATSRSRFWADVAKLSGIHAEKLEADFAPRLYFLADEADAKVAGAADDEDSAGESTKQNIATQLVRMAEDSGATMWRNADGDTYITLPSEGHSEHHRTNSGAVRKWLSYRFYSSAGRAPGAQAIADATGILEGVALYQGEEHPVWLRSAELVDKIYLDIGDASWRAIEIDAAGWRIIENPPVRFRRPKAMMALPMPDENGDVRLLRDFLNLDVIQLNLVMGWLVAAMRPRGPYPILALHGEQGTGKSTAAKLLRILVDPNSGLVRRMPNEPRDLASLASNSWVMAMDNVSTVPPWLSDALCCLSTGGAFASRQLFTDGEEALFTASRPIVMNGITDFVERSDLLDRTLSVTLEPIGDEHRRQERQMMNAFEEAKPKILGGLLNALSCGLRRLDSIQLDGLPRMADFVIWAEACGEALSWYPGEFSEWYAENRKQLNSQALEGSAIAKLLLDNIAADGWSGTASELLSFVSHNASEEQKRAKDFPRSPQAMGGLMRRLAPNFRAEGLNVDMSRRHGGTRLIRIERDTQ